MKKTLLICSSLFALSTAHATPFTIDGSLADWGVVTADNNGSNYAGLRSDLAGYMIEDTNDNAGDGGYVGPNYGGQNYDGEFLGVAVNSGKLYIGIQSGQRPDNGLLRYSPGDLILTTDAGVFGIEVGGGAGGGSGTAITEGASGSTYNLYSNGYTQSHSTAAAAQVAGSMWSDVNWILDPISPKKPVQMQIDGDSNFLGLADYIFTRNTSTSQHSVIELAIDMAMLGGATLQSVTWSPSCGNDELFALVEYEQVSEAPMVAIMLTSLLALVRIRRSA